MYIAQVNVHAHHHSDKKRFTLMPPMNWQQERLRNQLGDKKCERCGTLIAYSKGVSDCPRCHGKDALDLIDIHIAQAETQRQNRNLGMIFFGGLVVLMAVGYVIYAV